MNNLETLQFGFVRPENQSQDEAALGHRLYVDVPTDIYGAALEASGIEAAFDAAKPMLEPVDIEGGKRLYIVPNQFKLKKAVDYMHRLGMLGRVLNILDALDEQAHPDQKDPLISVSTHVRSGRNHANGLRVSLTLPDESYSEQTLSTLATNQMGHMAALLDYKSHRATDEIVEAVVSRTSDIQLHVKSTKRREHSLSTDVQPIPDSTERLLIDRNLHRNERKIICVAGAVAIAHAEDLLS